MTILDFVFLILVGFFSGFLNVMAAGGSMFVVPFLIFLGLPPSVANATNRLAVLLHTSVAVMTFKQQKVLDLKTDKTIILPSLLGAMIGAYFATDIDEQVLETIIGGLLVLMFFIFLFDTRKWMNKTDSTIIKQPKWVQFIVFLFIGFYSGFVQMGAGFFILANFVITSKMNLLRANALKSLIICICTIVSTAIFIYNDLIKWEIGLVLAIGNVSGAYFASILSVKMDVKYIRYFVLFALIAVAIKMFGAI